MAEHTPRPEPFHSPLDHPLHGVFGAGLLAALCALPWLFDALDMGFYTGVASRILIFALAATSLNLVLGFGGMVSFGHAAFLGLGAYTTGVLMQHGVTAAWVAWPLAAAVAAVAALAIGAISLRTQGVYFIMITLAFAQMLYYLAVSLKTYGGDDGLALPLRNTLGGVDLSGDTPFYFTVLTLGGLAFLLVHRWVNAPLGHALQAVRENEPRMAALGYPVLRIKLVAFGAGGALAGLAGALLSNQTGFVSPAMMQWGQSGMLMIMVILGGVGRLYGGLVGAAVFLVAEEVLATYTIHWSFGLGLVLLAVVLRAPNGVLSLLMPRKGE